MKGHPYLKPAESVRYLNEKLRKQKEEEKVIRDKILKESVDMAASKEKQTALVFRFLEEKKLIDAQVKRRKVVKEFTGKPDLTMSLKSIKQLDYCHPGKWIKAKFQDKEMWSCCASEMKDSTGCQTQVLDKLAWKFDN